GNVRPRPGGSRALHGSHAINRLARETAGDDAGGGPCSRTAADARRLMRKDTSVRGPTEAGPSTGRTRPAVSGDCRGAVISPRREARGLRRTDTAAGGPTEAGPSTGRTRPAVSGDCRGAVI